MVSSLSFIEEREDLSSLLRSFTLINFSMMTRASMEWFPKLMDWAKNKLEVVKDDLEKKYNKCLK